MLDHTKLIEQLRFCSAHFSCADCFGECKTASNEPRTKDVLNDAADAIEELLDRLATYEDTGMTLEEVKAKCAWADNVCKMLSGIFEDSGVFDFSHIKELITADQEGRLVVLPCKVGDHLYATECGSVREVIADLFHYDGHCLEITYHYNHFGYVEGMGAFGLNVFSTREEAEKTLEGVSEDAG